MKKNILSAALATLLTFSTADAVVITVDDFATPQGPISDLTANGIAVTNLIALAGLPVTNRELSIDALGTTSAPITNRAEVIVGILDVENGVGDDSQVMVTWNLSPNIFPFAVINAGFRFNVDQSDGNPTDVSLFIGATNLGNFAIPGNTINQILDFALNPALVAAVNAGGALKLTVNGDPGWDLALRQLDLTFNEQTVIPEPGTISLLGLGLLGLGWSYRRRSGSTK